MTVAGLAMTGCHGTGAKLGPIEEAVIQMTSVNSSIDNFIH